MNERLIERLLWIASAAALLIALATSYRPVETPSPRTSAPTPAAELMREASSASAFESAVASIVSRNMFSTERRPMPAVKPPVAAEQRSIIPSKPQLVLRGLIGGPPWDALLEGVPGREGSVVLRGGRTIMGFRLTIVRNDTAYIEGMDTLWTLTVRRP
jgi:hypothetical protein